ncbi:MAG TPA: hypothetical protein PL070_09775 [Flavobacteriales bacterium]|nr:hypothetical protein [Flavobacteriales bacterium]
MSNNVMDKQIELLRWLQQCMDHTKQLRFQLPVVIIGIQLLTMSFLVKDINSYSDLQGIGVFFVAVFTVVGLIANWLIHRRYDRMAHSLLYLRQKLDMVGPDFYDVKNRRGPELDPKENMPGIFYLNYLVIFIVGATIIITHYMGLN